MDKLFVECDCNSEAIVVEKQDDGEIWFSFWQEGLFNKKYTFKQKLQLIKCVLKNGNPWVDMVILNKTKIAKLVDFLKE